MLHQLMYDETPTELKLKIKISRYFIYDYQNYRFVDSSNEHITRRHRRGYFVSFQKAISPSLPTQHSRNACDKTLSPKQTSR